MESEEYRRLFEREKNNFWYIGRREVLEEVLNRAITARNDLQILDVGCGTGGNLPWLKKFGLVYGLDFSRSALDYAEQAGYCRLWQAGAEDMPLEDKQYDLVTALDVLEHVKNDSVALSEMCRVLKPGGYLLITVPAYGFLWSNHDVVLHHFRRYSLSEILLKLRAINGGVEAIEYQQFVFLGIFSRLVNILKELVWKIAGRKVIKKTYDFDPPAWINGFLLFILRCEKYLMRHSRLRFGTTIVVLIKKV